MRIIAGKDRGKSGKVLKVFPKDEKILVEGVAMKKRHRRPRKAREKGQVVTMPSPIHISNVMLYCKTCDRGVRIGYQILDGGPASPAGRAKLRICKKCKNEI